MIRLRERLGLALVAAGVLALLAPLAARQLAGRVQPAVSPPAVPPLGASPAEAGPEPGRQWGRRAVEPAAPPVAEGYRLEIPAIGLGLSVVEGIEDADLDRGPGHYPQTPVPGPGGNAAIAGHRTRRGLPAYFYRLNELKPGDSIKVVYSDRTLTYRVQRVYLTSPFDLAVLNPTERPALTLTTCDPPGADERRLIVRAELEL